MRFDDFLKWHQILIEKRLNDKLENEEADYFIKAINIYIDCETRVSNYHQAEWKRIDAAIYRHIALRDEIQKIRTRDIKEAQEMFDRMQKEEKKAMK